MAQQTTSVEWLSEQIEQYILTFGNLPFNVLNKFKEQAKAMEKEQIAKAWDAGKHQYFSMGIPEIEFNNGDEYYNINYNETYNK